MEQGYFSNEFVQSKRVFYTPTAFAKENLLFLQETGTLKALRPHESGRNYLNSYLFAIVLKGKGYIKYENQTYSLNEKQAFFLDCHKPYLQSSSKDLWQLQWVHFSGTSLSNIYRQFCERNHGFLLSLSSCLPYQEILDQLYEIANQQSSPQSMEINETLSQLLTRIMKDGFALETEVSKQQPVMEEVYTYLVTHYQEKITLDDLSARFFMNKYYLIRLFKKHYGLTVFEALMHIRIEKARQRLRFYNDSIQEIALSTGFKDVAYFSRKFKEIEGLSPIAFRKQWR